MRNQKSDPEHQAGLTIIGENTMKQKMIYESQAYAVNTVFIFPSITEVTALTFLSIYSL